MSLREDGGEGNISFEWYRLPYRAVDKKIIDVNFLRPYWNEAVSLSEAARLFFADPDPAENLNVDPVTDSYADSNLDPFADPSLDPCL